MEQQSLAHHETMEIHELYKFKAICASKAKFMKDLVSDQNLKTLLEKDVQASAKAVNDLQNLLAQPPKIQ